MTKVARPAYIETMSRMMRSGLALAAAVLTIVAIFVVFKNRSTPKPVREQAATAVPARQTSEPAVTAESVVLKPGDTLAAVLIRAGMDDASTAQIVAAAGEKFDLRKLRAGSELKLMRSETGQVNSLEYLMDADHTLKLSQDEGAYVAAVHDVPATIQTVPVCGTLEGSLFESIERTGERPDLAIQMAEIFAYDLDFYLDPRQGDEFCLVVEKKEYTNGQPPSYLRIHAAKYNNAGTVYEAFQFADREGKARYYSGNGKSLQSAFLRSPMKFQARISSRFSHRRLHPVLKRYRAHLGTDYAAPRGTPVQSVASGTVVFSGRSGGSGNLVRIRHANGFETYYLHLSRRLVRKGQRVAQGQQIGTVGSTGLASGPHLDFRIRKNGRFIDFQRLRLPRETTVPTAQAQAFAVVRDRYAAIMNQAAQPTELASAGATAAQAGTP